MSLIHLLQVTSHFSDSLSLDLQEIMASQFKKKFGILLAPTNTINHHVLFVK